MTMLVVNSENSGCDPIFLFPGIGVATWLFLSLLHFYVTNSIRCRDIISVVSLFNSCHSFLFRLRHHLVVLSLQAGRDSNFLVFLFSCRDVDIRSRPSSFFNHCNSCRDLKSMSQPFFLSIQLQPHFSVSIVSIQFSISGHDLSRPGYLAFYCILCRDLKSMSRHHLFCQPLILGHNSPFHVAT